MNQTSDTFLLNSSKQSRLNEKRSSTRFDSSALTMLNSKKSKNERELKGSVSIGKNSLLEKEIKSFID